MSKIMALPVRTYRDLRVWQMSKQLCLAIYKETNSFPNHELYGLSNQMRRAAVSIPSNIAEGHARSTKEFIRFLDIALGSVAELETQIEIALELEYWDKAVAHGLLEQADHITKMLGKMSHSLKQKTSNPESQIANPNHG